MFLRAFRKYGEVLLGMRETKAGRSDGMDVFLRAFGQHGQVLLGMWEAPPGRPMDMFLRRKQYGQVLPELRQAEGMIEVRKWHLQQ